MAPVVGMRFGRYELLEQIGAGGMGEVYRARDHDLQRNVAVKFLPERFASNTDRLARFAQEARTASALNHPNIVTIHEIGQTGGLPYIVMEYVEGETLRQIVRKGPLTARRALELGAQLADGLAKAHAAGIVHRDLKPENVMVTGDGYAKILDFGLAKLRGDGSDGPAPADRTDPTTDAETQISAQTAAGVVMGTAGYMAPEQARGLPADHRSDQFALGAILYEMATGRRAFHRASFVETLSAIVESEPDSITALNPSFPAPARWAVERCLSKEPTGRYASTLDLARELRSVREHFAEVVTPASGQAPAPRPRHRTRPWHMAVVAALALVIVALIPALRDGFVRWIRPAPLPDEIRIAVILDDLPLPPVDRERLAGLVDYIVIRLADLNRFRASVSVVPASEVRESLVRSPGEARRRVGATLAVSLGARRADEDLVVSVSLEDTERLRVLGGTQKRFRGDEYSEDEIVDLVADLLRLELAAKERAAWSAASTGVAEARSLFARGLSQTPYQTAQTALEKYDQEQSIQRAIDFFSRAIELDPRYADAYARLGEAYLWRYRLTRRPEDIALAERNATRARELDDTRPGTWITIGMVHAQKGDFVQAELDLESAIARNPRGSLAYRELARVNQRAGQNDRAEANYRKAVELDPQSWSNYSHLGAFLYGANRFAEAEEAFQLATTKAPDNARAWSNLGAAYYGQKRIDDAVKALSRAVALYNYGPALSNLGTIALRERRQYAEAARLFERGVEAAPRDYRIWRNLAAAYYWMPGGRDRAAAPLRKAISLLEEARGIEPASAELLAELADSHAMLGEGATARPLAAEAVRLAPTSTDVAVLAAGTYETLGDRAAALRQVDAAFQAGADTSEFESDQTFDRLVKDARYAALVKKGGGE